MLSDSLVDRDAQFVDRGATKESEIVPSLWNINTFVFLGGFLGGVSKCLFQALNSHINRDLIMSWPD